MMNPLPTVTRLGCCRGIGRPMNRTSTFTETTSKTTAGSCSIVRFSSRVSWPEYATTELISVTISSDAILFMGHLQEKLKAGRVDTSQPIPFVRRRAIPTCQSPDRRSSVCGGDDTTILDEWSSTRKLFYPAGMRSRGTSVRNVRVLCNRDSDVSKA